MDKNQAFQTLSRFGILVFGHFVYNSGRHGAVYINKAAIFNYPNFVLSVASEIAQNFSESDVEAVVGPAIGGAILAQWVAFEISKKFKRDIFAIFAEKDDQNSFVIKRGQDALISGKKILVVDNVLTTGGSVKKIIERVKILKCDVAGVGVFWNRGGVGAEALNIKKLFSCINIQFEDFGEADCTLCQQGIPINTDFGYGRKFLARKQN